MPYAVIYGVSSVIMGIVDLQELGGSGEQTAGIFILTLPVHLLATVGWAMFHCQCWKALPERLRFTTPGKAVGFLFIPFYNFYWAFISWPKLGEGLWQWQQENHVQPLVDLRNLMMAYAVVFVSGFLLFFIPEVSIVYTIADLILFLVIYKSVETTVNQINQRPA